MYSSLREMNGDFFEDIFNTSPTDDYYLGGDVDIFALDYPTSNSNDLSQQSKSESDKTEHDELDIWLDGPYDVEDEELNLFDYANHSQLRSTSISSYQNIIEDEDENEIFNDLEVITLKEEFKELSFIMEDDGNNRNESYYSEYIPMCIENDFAYQTSIKSR